MSGSYMNEFKWMGSGVIITTWSRSATARVSVLNNSLKTLKSPTVWLALNWSVIDESLIRRIITSSAVSLIAIDKTTLFSKLMHSGAFRQFSASWKMSGSTIPALKLRFKESVLLNMSANSSRGMELESDF